MAHTKRHFLQSLLCLALLVPPAVGSVHAQTFPSKPIRFISPSGAGLINDTMTRLVADRLRTRLGWVTVVENKPGGNYVIGTQALLNAPADGHTVLAAVSSLPVVQHTVANVPFDLRRDITPLTRVMGVQLVLFANVAQPYATLRELVAYSKANPGRLSFGALGIGSLTHLAGELVKLQAGVDMMNVPYKDETLMLDTIAGNVQLGVLTVSSALPNIRAGKLRPIALLGPQRSPQLPDVPTATESGTPGIDADGWHGMVIRAGTPAAIVERLHSEIVAVAQLPDVQEKLRALGALPMTESSDQFRQKIDSDLSTWGRVIRESKLKMN